MSCPHQQPIRKFSQAGFTLIESLLAILVVAILMTAMAPVIVLSTATRIQAKRVELGTQAATAYINGLASGTIPAPPNTVITDGTDPSKKFLLRIRNVQAPTSSGSLNIPAGTYATAGSTQLYCIDNDGNGFCRKTDLADMVVQAVRSVTKNPATPEEAAAEVAKGYSLSVRVYRADAFNSSEPLKKSDIGQKVAQTTFSGGLGDRKAPVIELTAEINPVQPKLSDFCSRLGCQ